MSLKLLRRRVVRAEGFNSFWRVITKRTRLDRWESEVLESRSLTLSPTHRAHVIIKKNPWLSRSHLRLNHNFFSFCCYVTKLLAPACVWEFGTLLRSFGAVRLG